MAIFSPVQEVSAFLDSYWSREHVLRTLQYGSWMLSGITETLHPLTSRKLLTVTERVGQTRVVLRLLDDLPMLASTLRKWRTKSGKTQNLFLMVTELLDALSGQLYYPTEHLAWAADNNLIGIDSGRLWALSVVLWLLSLVANLIQSMATIARLSKDLTEVGGGGSERGTPPQEQNEEGSNGGRKRVSFKDQEMGARARLHAMRRQRFFAILTVFQSLADLVNAVNWLPQGILWSGRLSNSWIGFFGTISSLIGLYKILPRRLPGSQKQL